MVTLVQVHIVLLCIYYSSHQPFHTIQPETHWNHQVGSDKSEPDEHVVRRYSPGTKLKQQKYSKDVFEDLMLEKCLDMIIDMQ